MAIQVGGTTVVDNSKNIINVGNISLSGNVTASGNVSGGYFIGDGSNLTGISAGASSAKAYFLATA